MIIDLKMCMSRSFHSKKSYLCIIGMIAALYINGLGAIIQQKESASFNDIVAVSISSGFIILYYILSVFWRRTKPVPGFAKRIYKIHNCKDEKKKTI